jgi:hypothetical protein
MRNSIYLFIIVLFAFAACKKSGSSSSKCQVATVSLVPTAGTPTVVNFTYDDNGKLKFMNTGAQVAEYFYRSNGFTRRTSSGNGWYTNQYVEFNASGLPIVKKDSTYNGQSLSNSSIYTFEYNNQGELIKTFKDNSAQPLETFTWSSGNLVKYQSGNTAYIMDYFPDKANRDFCFLDLQIFVFFGTNPAKSKNLLKSLTSGGNQINFQYQFDTRGNIKEWVATALGSPDTVMRATQQFICN